MRACSSVLVWAIGRLNSCTMFMRKGMRTYVHTYIHACIHIHRPDHNANKRRAVGANSTNLYTRDTCINNDSGAHTSPYNKDINQSVGAHTSPHKKDINQSVLSSKNNAQTKSESDPIRNSNNSIPNNASQNDEKQTPKSVSFCGASNNDSIHGHARPTASTPSRNFLSNLIPKTTSRMGDRQDSNHDFFGGDSNHVTFCANSDTFCAKNDTFCAKNDTFCAKNDTFCGVQGKLDLLQDRLDALRQNMQAARAVLKDEGGCETKSALWRVANRYSADA